VIWNTDSSGNYLSGSGSLSGTSSALENYETVFNHDLNGDGTIGLPPSGHASSATTAAVQHSSGFSFSENSQVDDNHTTPSLLSVASSGVGASSAVAASHFDNFSFAQEQKIAASHDPTHPSGGEAAGTNVWYYFGGSHQDLDFNQHGMEVGVQPGSEAHHGVAWHFDLLS